jgi:hypothetical protein
MWEVAGEEGRLEGRNCQFIAGLGENSRRI